MAMVSKTIEVLVPPPGVRIPPSPPVPIVEPKKIMTNHAEFVKSQIVFHEKMADKFKANLKRRERHLETASQLQALHDHLTTLEAQPAAQGLPKVRGPFQLSLSFDEIEGLPPDLIKELSFSDSDRTDFTILRIVEESGGVASLDRILVGYYKETGEIMKRNTMTSRVYRMSQKGMLFPVPGKKGAYSTEELSDEEAQELAAR